MSGVASRAEAEDPKEDKAIRVPVLTFYHRAENLHCWRVCSHDPLDDEERPVSKTRQALC